MDAVIVRQLTQPIGQAIGRVGPTYSQNHKVLDDYYAALDRAGYLAAATVFRDFCIWTTVVVTVFIARFQIRNGERPRFS